MNEQDRFKEAMNEISVPSKELDTILADSFKQEKKQWKFPFIRIVKYTAVVGILSMGLISSAYVSPAFANFVTKIPIIGQAFDYFIELEDYYQAYEEISTDIGLVQESNGIEIIIEKAFYDGNTVTLSYVIRDEGDLGSSPTFENLPKNIVNGGYEGGYVNGVGYVGMMTLSMRDKTQDKVNIEWSPLAIYSGEKVMKGDWYFKFSLSKLKGKQIVINEQVNKEGVTVELIDAIKTDVNLTINYLQDIDPAVHERWNYVEAELSAIDNLGNKYEVPYNGGSGTVDGDSSEDITWNATIHGLDPEATSITFYPFAHVSNSQSDNERIDFEPITIELN
ncbi:DUF4179 domain-containing protein [Lysinibacillus sphaericus]|uniref:ECF-type sigma factor negative effector n=3 Tax=Lysinibacillus TaxID=400634 RepID=B1HMD6_LYSSC|nr:MULTISPECIES: DUF4179 domain-containing protein [Lysinibacillus]MBE5082102.1 DUF4179 domain-containing protein [Bacillus thuringiensis]ACA38708.1 ECF-type sigma factor negative effector [Lysinibacillus sphaericus C3-41]AMO31035.1 hypothetical protein AR327_00065 [Lysinibacillus sphaericus]AMR89858.1 hypothetical protein A1T07_06610 [Lysinibacillus sphaericus]ANA47928.1 hypothetical protein A2J09_21810 [Lysinibacillus sphaericus]